MTTWQYWEMIFQAAFQEWKDWVWANILLGVIISASIAVAGWIIYQVLKAFRPSLVQKVEWPMSNKQTLAIAAAAILLVSIGSFLPLLLSVPANKHREQAERIAELTPENELNLAITSGPIGGAVLPSGIQINDLLITNRSERDMSLRFQAIIDYRNPDGSPGRRSVDGVWNRKGRLIAPEERVLPLEGGDTTAGRLEFPFGADELTPGNDEWKAKFLQDGIMRVTDEVSGIETYCRPHRYPPSKPLVPLETLVREWERSGKAKSE